MMKIVVLCLVLLVAANALSTEHTAQRVVKRIRALEKRLSTSTKTRDESALKTTLEGTCLITARKTTLAATETMITCVRDTFKNVHDHRAVFPTAYVEVTKGVREDLAAGDVYSDNTYITNLLLEFAELYRVALHGYFNAPGDIPMCWKDAFDVSKAGNGLVAIDLALGMNAHINHDLAIATSVVGAQEEHSGDFFKVERTLTRVTSAILTALGSFSSVEGISSSRDLLGSVGTHIQNIAMRIARYNAWTDAQALAQIGDSWISVPKSVTLLRIKAAAGTISTFIKGVLALIPQAVLDELRTWEGQDIAVTLNRGIEAVKNAAGGLRYLAQ
jgi:hypothetical protein